MILPQSLQFELDSIGTGYVKSKFKLHGIKIIPIIKKKNYDLNLDDMYAVFLISIVE